MNNPRAAGVANAWEAAYLRFESPAEEVRKFRRRLLSFGASDWPRDSRIVELFCGRGNGMHAWAGLGFSNLTGVDLSPGLIELIDPTFNRLVGDARKLPLTDQSVDIISIQGGLHHLLKLPEDLSRVLGECRRVLRPCGRLLIVEPWSTPFLRLVHFCVRRRLLRRLWPKLDALAEMIDLEADTYFAWLAQPEVVLATLRELFPGGRCEIAWGKLRYLALRA